jgi:hypothetical protein
MLLKNDRQPQRSALLSLRVTAGDHPKIPSPRSETFRSFRSSCRPRRARRHWIAPVRRLPPACLADRSCHTRRRTGTSSRPAGLAFWPSFCLSKESFSGNGRSRPISGAMSAAVGCPVVGGFSKRLSFPLTESCFCSGSFAPRSLLASPLLRGRNGFTRVMA